MQYENLGYLNDKSDDAIKAIESRWQACISEEHRTQCIDTERGDHRRWCHDCLYRWGYDSGD